MPLPWTTGPSSGHTLARKSVDFDGSTEYLETDTKQVLGLTDASILSASIWVNHDDADGASARTFETWLTFHDAVDASTSIQLQYRSAGNGTNPEAVQAFFKNDANATVVDYRWETHASNPDIPLTDATWYNIIIALDRTAGAGARALCWVNGTEQTNPTLTEDSAAGTITDSARHAGISTNRPAGTATAWVDGKIGHVIVWDAKLDGNDATVIHSQKFHFDPNRNQGGYDKASNVLMWWKLGEDSSSIGENYETTATWDLDTTGGITSDDIGVDIP